MRGLAVLNRQALLQNLRVGEEPAGIGWLQPTAAQIRAGAGSARRRGRRAHGRGRSCLADRCLGPDGPGLQP
jgi:hypothetical protein